MSVLRTSTVMLLGLLLCGGCVRVEANIWGATTCAIEANSSQPCWEASGTGPWEEWDEWMYCVRIPSDCKI